MSLKFAHVNYIFEPTQIKISSVSEFNGVSPFRDIKLPFDIGTSTEIYKVTKHLLPF